MSSQSKTLTGPVHVAASVSFGRWQKCPFLPRFLALHTQVDVELHLSDSGVDIAELGFDMAFRIADLASSTLKARKIDDNAIHLVASPAYRARGRPSGVRGPRTARATRTI